MKELWPLNRASVLILVSESADSQTLVRAIFDDKSHVFRSDIGDPHQDVCAWWDPSDTTNPWRYIGS